MLKEAVQAVKEAFTKPTQEWDKVFEGSSWSDLLKDAGWNKGEWKDAGWNSDFWKKAGWGSLGVDNDTEQDS